MNDQVPALTSGISQLDNGAASLSDGATSLASGLVTLDQGAGTAASSAQTLADGVARLASGAASAQTGSQTLSSGLATARSGSQTLADGAAQLASGAQDLEDGAGKLNDGATTLADGLGDGVDQIPSYTQDQRETMSSVASDVAGVDTVREHAVANNGAGFTPMFMSLALWVGAIALFLVLPALDKRDHGERWWASAIRPATTALLLAMAQAVIMMVAVNAAGELHAANLLGLALMAIASSVCFMAINQACVASLAFRGRFVSIVLLSLQITSMGATFPIETAPRFFQWIHPFLPMSYTQLSFRRLIAGGGLDGIYLQTLGVLLIWTAIAVCVTLLGARLRRGRTPLPADNALAPRPPRTQAQRRRRGGVGLDSLTPPRRLSAWRRQQAGLGAGPGLPQPRVLPAGSHELVMAAQLDDPSVNDDGDPVRRRGRVQAVGDGDDGAPSQDRVQGALG